ncbi:MAG: Coenzyme F420:L-glutamate ligase [bacterium ADurb.Bin212]|nr:MAG: Coenzyme F420:L-glutamate ligase [bacterium ADurb.Bin212]
MKFSQETLFLAEIYNYSCKGIIAGLGKGEGITKKIKLLSYKIDENSDYKGLAKFLLASNLLDDGDIIALPSKVISIIEKRFVNGVTVENYKKCITDLDYARKNLKVMNGGEISRRDQIGLDKINPEKKLGVIYPKNPNLSAHQISKEFEKISGDKIDVVITDSDSGAIKGVDLIGCPTVINTPIASTKGLGLFYAMRIAVAAEISWNNLDYCPILLVKPYEASRIRESIGEIKYNGFLDANRENDYLKFLDS